MKTSLQKLSKAKQWLIDAKSLDDVKHIIDIAEAARVYSRAAKLGLEAQNEAAEIKLRAERKAGEMLAQLERSPVKDNPKAFQAGMPTSEYREVLDEQEIPTTTAHRWESISKLPERSFENYIQEKQNSKEEITTAGMLRVVSNTHVSDKTYEWYTPKEYIEAARTTMGSIDLDPASHKLAQTTVGATKYYTIETDGLGHVWTGNVFLNPPYSMPLIEDFTSKAIIHFEAGDINQAIVLTNNSTDTTWFHALSKYPFCLTKGRINFWNGKGVGLATRQGQAFFYLGENVLGFVQNFSKLGVVVKRYDN